MFHTASQCRNGNVTFRGTIPDITSRRRHCTGMYWLFNRDPYNGNHETIPQMVVFHGDKFYGIESAKKQIQLVGGFNQPE